MVNKKVLFIIEDLCEGGAEKVFVHIANGFSSAVMMLRYYWGGKKEIFLIF